MTDMSKELGISIDMHQSGAPMVVEADEQGIRRSRLQMAEDMQAMGAGGYRDIYALSEAADAPVTEAEVGGTMAGFVPGKVAGLVGAPGDIAALATGLYKAAFPEPEQGRLDAFIQQVEEVSNKYGSGATLGFLDDWATQSGISDEVKQGFMQGAEVGSFFGLGQGAAATGKGAAAAGKAIAEGAPARIAERGEGVTLGMGVDPMAPIDEAIVGAQKLMGKGGKSIDELTKVAVTLPRVGSEQFPINNIAGKKVVFVPADMLDFGRAYGGLSEAPIEPRALKGGSKYGTLETSRKQGLGFASLDPKIAKRIADSGADYMLVSTMSPRAHRSNIDFANILHRQMRSYADEGYITPENQLAISQALTAKFPKFPDIFSDEALPWLEAQSFETRAAIADTLDAPGMRGMGAPPVSRLINETINPTEAGYPIGQGSVLIKMDKKAPVDVREMKDGVPHPSYPIGLFGEPVAEIPYGVKVDDIFDEYIGGKLATGSTPASAYRALTMALPTTELTPERLSRIPTAKPGFIKSARQAQLVQDVVQGNWRSTINPVGPAKNRNPLGLGGAEIIKATQENELSATLSTYTKSELAAKAKTKELVFYGLGKQGGTSGKVYFGLNKNTNYADMYGATSPDLTANETAIVGVMNNEAGNVGKGIGSASILKALQEGATVLDAYAVPSAKHPKGFLPKYYSQFGFVEVERIPYNESYLRNPDFGGSEEKYKRITRQWKASGWDETKGNPDLVIMKWKGDENVRSTATDTFISKGSDGLRGSGFEYVQARGGDIEPRAGSGLAGQQRPSRSSDAGGNRRGAGDGGGSMGASLQRGASELTTLDPTSKRALGLEE